MHEVRNDRGVGETLEDFVHQLRRKGITLWMDEAGLRYRAPKGLMTAAEREVLSSASGAIAALLQPHSRFSGCESPVSSSTGLRRTPLSFSQLEHWHYRLLYEGRPIRHLASALRLHGPLRAELLKESVAAVGHRHDALRTRIVARGDMPPIQETAERYLPVLEVIDLGRIPQSRRGPEIELHIHRAILDARDYATSPLFRLILLTLTPSEHVLVLAMDHIISDLVSLQLVLEETFAAYAQLLVGGAISLPRVAVQFPDHAARLQAEPPEMLTRVAKRLNPVARTRFPQDIRPECRGDHPGLGRVCFLIDRGLGESLRAWARRHGTTVVIATLTAYAALVLRWCDTKDTIILFTTDGRTDPKLERTIGYVAFDVYVRVTLERRTNFLDLLRIVTEEYCRACDEADFGYAAAQKARPEFTRNTGINWLKGETDGRGALALGSEGALQWSPVEFANPVWQAITNWDEEPRVVLSERDGAIAGQLGYARSMFSDMEMARFATNITEFMTAMITAPTRAVMDMELK